MIDLAGIIVEAMAFLGVLLLMFPAFHAAKYARLLARLELARPTQGVPGQAAFNNARGKLANHRDSWSWWKGICLYLGTGFTILGAAGAVVTAVAKVTFGE